MIEIALLVDNECDAIILEHFLLFLIVLLLPLNDLGPYLVLSVNHKEWRAVLVDVLALLCDVILKKVFVQQVRVIWFLWGILFQGMQRFGHLT